MATAEVLQTRRKRDARKGVITRLKATVEAACQSMQQHPSPQARDYLISLQEKVELAWQNFENATTSLLEIDTSQTQHSSYNTEYNAYAETKDNIISSILTAVAPTHPTPSTLADTSMTAPPTLRAKPDLALKPSDLLRSFTPRELTKWIARFTAYYTQSNMTAAPSTAQHEYLYACLDATLHETLRSSVTPATPIFGSDGCLAILKAHFLREYPTFNRRMDFISASRKARPYAEWIADLKSLFQEADIDSLKPDDFLALILYNGEDDSELLNLYNQVAIPSSENLIQVGLKYTAGLKKKEREKERGREPEATPNTLTAANVAAISQSPRRPQGPAGPTQQPLSGTARFLQRHPDMRGKCIGCGSVDHLRRDCPHAMASCLKCGRKGHLASVCKAVQQRLPPQAQRIRSIEQSTSGHPTVSYPEPQNPTEALNAAMHSFSTASINAITVQTIGGAQSRPTPRIQLTIRARNATPFNTTALPDSGAERTIIPFSLANTYNLVPDPSLPTPTLKTASGEPLDCRGSVKVYLQFGSQRACTEALISKDIREPIVSWGDLIQLGILNRSFADLSQAPVAPNMSEELVAKVDTPENSISALIEEFPDVLDDSGRVRPMKGPPMKIILRDDISVTPVKTLTARRTPIHQEVEANIATQEALDNGIIVPQDGPTDWILPSFFVSKGAGQGQRLVTDFSPLNKYVKRPVHPFLCVDDTISSIPPTAKCFAKLDCKQGYFQIPLDKESSLLTTMLLPSGKYRYSRAPMGLNASSDEFCLRTDQALKGIPGMVKLVDDILIFAEDEDTLYRRVREVLQRCRSHGITISRKKLQIGREVPFAGYVVSGEGVRPDPERTEAISQFPRPQSRTELRSFLGLANTLGRYIPDLSIVTHPMRSLLKESNVFLWTEAQESSFLDTKRLLCSDLLVRHFDPKLQTTLITDASKLEGIGYVLLQHDPEKPSEPRLVRCGSRVLNPSERNYAPIELEALALVWAIEHCRLYLYGMQNPFKVITDHMPLVGLFKRFLDTVPNARLGRFKERVCDYHFIVEWAAGKTNQIADALSRKPLSQPCTVSAIQSSPISPPIDPQIQEIIDHADADPEYQSIIKTLMGDPNPKAVPESHPARPYTSRDNLPYISLRSGILCKGDRIIPPKSLRAKMLQLLHLSHSGISKTKQLAHQLFYWPTMNNEIVQLIQSCSSCQRLRPSQPTEPLLHSVVSQPMDLVSVDLATLKGRDYLIMSDRYSSFLFVYPLQKTDTSSVLTKLLATFHDFGLPKRIRSDNGPQFRTDFSAFCKANNIIHETSSPYNPQSNGAAEAAVKQAKHLLEKHNGYNASFLRGLSAWRNTPLPSKGRSPAELFLGRKLHGLWPILTKPASQRNPSPIQSHRTLPTLKNDTPVIIQDPTTKRWTQTGTIANIRPRGRSYIIKTESGFIVRNRRFIKPASSGNHGDKMDGIASQPMETPTLRRSPRIRASSRTVHLR